MRQLHRNDETYRRLFGDHDLAVLVMSDGIEECNDSACRLLGRPREALIGRTPLEFSPERQPDGAATAEIGRSRIAAALGGLPQSFLWEFSRLDGESVEGLVHLEAVRLDSRVRLFAYVRDLSHLWRAEASLRETETRLKQILDHTSSIVLAKDLEGRYLFANPALERLLGVPVNQLIGRPFGGQYPREVLERLELHDRQVLEEQRAIEVEERVTLRGETRTYLVNKFPLLNAGGTPYAICAIGTDITERQRTEEALRQAALAVSSPGQGTILDHLVRSLSEILETEFAFIATFSPANPEHMRTLASIADGNMKACSEYPLPGTPCAEVVRQTFRFFPRGVAQQFPQDPGLTVHGLESYAGFPLSDVAGNTIGLIAVMSRRPLRDVALCESVLKIFAGRAAAEIERDRAEEALRQSEASYRAIFDESEDGIFVHDWETGAIVDVNPKACESDGYPREELLSMKVGDISAGVPPYSAREAERLLDQARHGPVRFEWRSRHRSGRLAWKEICLKPARIAGVPRILAFSRDITARKGAEQALRASEEQYRSIFNASLDGLVLRDADLRIVDVNPAFLSMNGWTREELMATEPLAYVAPELRERSRQKLKEVRENEPIHYESVGMRKDGSRFDVEIRVVQIQYQGRPHLLSIVRDITARTQTEQALRASEEQYRAIFNASADGLVLRDEHLRIVDVNPVIEQMSGYRRDEIIGVEHADSVPEELRAEASEYHRRALHGEPIKFETVRMHRDGTRFDVELHDVPIRYRGKPHLLTIVRDITERKHAERDRLQLEAQLRQAQKMDALGQLTGGIAHDFNNILTTIMGNIVLADERQEALGDAKLGIYLGRTQRACERARDLIQQMLTFSRGGRGDPQPTRLLALVRESVQLLHSTLPSTLTLSMTGTGADAPPVMIDPVQAEQVLLNLCINARDATGAHGVVTIGVGTTLMREAVCNACRKPVTGTFVELSVRDSGPGIKPEIMDRLFEPFFTTKAVGKGTGMGLATVHGIVHEHGGHVLVESEPGRGANFRVLFPPLATAVPLAPQPEHAQPLAPIHRAVFSGRALLVDDEEMVLEFMRELLEGWGLEVTATTDSVAARDLLAREATSLDLLITDLTMPHVTGIDLARASHALRPTLPVILYTGYADGLSEAQARALGVASVLRKPVVPRDLLALLNAYLARAPVPLAGAGTPPY